MLRALFLVLLFCGIAAAQTPKKPQKPATTETVQRITKAGRPPQIDDVGRLIGDRYKVYQVQDAGNALIEIEWYDLERLDTGKGGPERHRLREHNEVAWLVDDTRGLVDGRLIHTTKTYKITGTKSYQSTLGKHTVLLLEVVPKDP